MGQQTTQPSIMIMDIVMPVIRRVKRATDQLKTIV